MNDRHLAATYPDSLVGLSVAELADVGRPATRDMDILLMPTLMALYVRIELPREFNNRDDVAPADPKDRQNVLTAKNGDLTMDLNMIDSQFAICVAVLFAGYSECQYDDPCFLPIDKNKRPQIS